MPQSSKTVAVAIAVVLFLTWVIRSTIRDEADETRVAMREAAETVMLDSIRSTIDSIASEGGELSSQAIESVGRIIKPSPGSGVESSTKPGSASRPEDASGSSIIGDLFRAGQQIAREIDDSIQDSVKLTSDEEIESRRWAMFTFD